jgi:hypothetical protein
MEVFNHPVVVGSLFLLLVFLPGVVGTIATMNACERLRVFHVKTYCKLGAPDYSKMNRWFTPLRKQWSGFLKSGEYLRLNDWRLTRLCKICLFLEWYGQIMGAGVIVFLGYNLIVQAGFL